MYTGDKKYDPTVLDNDESAERLRHEEEMQEALKRLSDRSARKKRSFLAAVFGVLVGLLYILWITFGPGIMLNDGKAFMRRISRLPEHPARCMLCWTLRRLSFWLRLWRSLPQGKSAANSIS